MFTCSVHLYRGVVFATVFHWDKEQLVKTSWWHAHDWCSQSTAAPVSNTFDVTEWRQRINQPSAGPIHLSITCGPARSSIQHHLTDVHRQSFESNETLKKTYLLVYLVCSTKVGTMKQFLPLWRSWFHWSSGLQSFGSGSLMQLICFIHSRLSMRSNLIDKIRLGLLQT